MTNQYHICMNGLSIPKSIAFFSFFIFLTLLLQIGCSAKKEVDVSSDSSTGGSIQTGKSRQELEVAQKALVSSTKHMEEIVRDATLFFKEAKWKERGFFNSEEDDQVEGLLFRYLAVHETLWNLVDQNKDLETKHASDPVSVRRAIIAFNAGLTQFYNDSRFVVRFQDDKIAVDKLNEVFYRSDIPKGTYDRIKLHVTDVGKLHALEKAWARFAKELKNPESMLAQIKANDLVYGPLIETTQRLPKGIDDNVQKIVAGDFNILPSVRNEIRHFRIAAVERETVSEIDSLEDATRATLFKSVSRLKNPSAHLIKFSDTQKVQVYEVLKPGDVLLSYTAGYVSSLFIPGAFKHAMVYVGTPEDRHGAGLTPEKVSGFPKVSQDALRKSVSQTKTVSGLKADLIEAVAEGVKFSNLANIMDTHINRLVVLRPQFNEEERRQALTEVFLFLGDGYDFKFDFADASEQVCTEVVYRAYNTKGNLAFSLTKRAGRETLSADDIINNYINENPEAYSFILLAVENPGSNDHQAEILTGDKGLQALSQLMKERSEK